MKVDKIAVCYERKFNLGDYNSLKLEATIWADVEDGEDANDVIAELQRRTREAVRSEFARVSGKVGRSQLLESKSQLPE